MKKRTSKLLSLLLTLTMVLGMLPAMSQVAYAAGDVAIDATNFPDANFRTFVKTYDTDSNGYLSEAELAAVTEMDCHSKEIADLTGIEHFTALTVLDCYDNKLTTLDVSKNTALTELYCYNNQLTSLDVSKNTALTYLDCGTNQLTALDVSANIALTYVRCTDNQLTSLDVSKNTALTMLYCSNNQLTTLDVSKNTQLTTLWCSGNQLTTLDVSANTALTYLWCYNNQLTTLDVSKNTNLKWLHCYGNNLTMLDVSAVPALKDAKENGTKDTSNSDYDNYSSSQGTLRVDKGFTNIITDAPADAATEYPVWVGGTQVTSTNKDDILGDGKVSFDPETNTLTFTGTPTIIGLHSGALISSLDIDLTINASNGLTLNNSEGGGVYVGISGISSDICSLTVNGDVTANTKDSALWAYKNLTVNGDVEAENSRNATLYTGNGSVSVTGSVTVDSTATGIAAVFSKGDVTIGGDVNATSAENMGIYSINGSITIGGNTEGTCKDSVLWASKDVEVTGSVNVKSTINAALYAGNGTINITGDVTAASTTNGIATVFATKDITIGGKTNVSSENHMGIYTSGGSISIGGDAEGSSKDAFIFASKDVSITGKVNASSSTNATLFAGSGNITVGGDVDVTCNATSNVAAIEARQGDVSLKSNATVISTSEQGIAGKEVKMTTGTWDVTASKTAIVGYSGITIPDTHGITHPIDGKFNQVTEELSAGVTTTYHTVTESDGTTIAAHAIIEPVFTVTVTDGTADKAEAFKGDTVTITANDKSGYTFKKWQIVSGEITLADASAKTTTFVMTASDVDVKATYTKNSSGGGGGGGYTYYTIKATAGVNGSISPAGSVSVRSGKDQTFTITPDKGYAISDVKIDGKSVGAVKSYTFENVKGNHTIKAIFMKANGNPQTGVFVDVPEGSYYEEAVAWAVENGITKGTSDTTFDPNGICTRAQAVTFLWRAAGSPAPKTSTMPFTDVKAGSYYYDAVLWAVENGITTGTSATTFSPDAECTRAQIVTFLWRAQKSPAADSVNPFTDVAADAYYVDAVLWAVEEKVTKGTSETTFSPDADCTRAQIVTFLYRALNEQ